jgi:hypothetical protein
MAPETTTLTKEWFCGCTLVSPAGVRRRTLDHCFAAARDIHILNVHIWNILLLYAWNSTWPPGAKIVTATNYLTEQPHHSRVSGYHMRVSVGTCKVSNFTAVIWENWVISAWIFSFDLLSCDPTKQEIAQSQSWWSNLSNKSSNRTRPSLDRTSSASDTYDYKRRTRSPLYCG